MKSKAPLSLMEQLIMLLVFALAAALCLQLFVLSSQLSRRCAAQSQVVSLVQNTAEAVKFCRGDVSRYPELLGGEGNAKQWQIGYDADWQETDLAQANCCILISQIESQIPGLGQAFVSAQTESEDVLFSLTVSWQEVVCE